MKWNDEYWPLLLNAYKKKPVGMKPLYSRSMIDIALMLHITPQELQRKMQEIERAQSPMIEQLMADYGNPRKLASAVKKLTQKQGYGTAGEFYNDIETRESWERDFRSLEANPQLAPVHLIVILNLYFTLTPATMTKETEEIQDLGKQMKLSATTIVEVLQHFQVCDPYLRGTSPLPLEADADSDIISILPACREVWARFGNGDEGKLHSISEQLMEYF